VGQWLSRTCNVGGKWVHVAVCCSVLQCVAVCCSVLHFFAVCCSDMWVSNHFARAM